ncbi:MAG: hypothetical protein JW741_22485, partial [Sedimentisphaerales bacterium]|nr:hypothetical protein [Sedimentisphaerales bacterium]
MGKKAMFLVLAVLLIGLSQSAANADLVAHWDLEEGSGTTTKALVGSPAADGTLVGATWATAGAPIAGSRAAVFFDSGNADRIETNQIGILGNAARSVTAWVKPEPVQNNNAVMVGWGLNNPEERFSFRLNAGAADGTLWALRLEIQGSRVVAETAVNDGEWHHVAITHDEGARIDEVSFYVDGQLDAQSGTGGGGSMNTASTTVVLGNSGHAPATYGFDGAMDEVRLYDRVLTADEIALLAFRPKASSPTPVDGTILDGTSANLSWSPGGDAVSYSVYFGESLDDVSAGQVEAISTTETSLSTALIPAYAAGLTAGQTYYWRVDAVNEANPDSPWTGNIWSFQVRPVVAWEPTPADGIRYVHPDQDLAWEIGLGTLFHTVYFGESFDEVNDATTGGFMIVDPTYDPGTLETEKTYYWRVDEFSGLATEKGDVWSFTTVPEVEVTDPSLTGWWTLDEGEGQTAVDWSGHGYHGAINGVAEWTDGYQGSALRFVDDVYVEAAYVGITGTASRTCMAWIKTGVANRSILSWGQNVAGQKWLMRVDATGGLRIEVNGGYNYGATSLIDNQWHHVAIVLEDDGSADVLETVLYVDGAVEASAASADEPIDTPATGVVRIGESPWHNRPWVGQIDDVRIYDRVLTEAEIKEAMRGNVLLASNPEPARGAIIDIREAVALGWQAGDGAVSHDVYFGTEKEALATADKDAAAYQGNQAATSFSLAGLVELGGGDYFWRIDEVAADASVQKGDVWSFTVPPYLIVDDFESYSNDVGERVFEFWIDGIGYTLPEPGDPGNGTGAAVGHDIWSADSPYFDGLIMETANVHGGNQAMPVYYNNTASPYLSEAERTWAVPENWVAEGVTDLTLFVRGDAANDPAAMYVAVE